MPDWSCPECGGGFPEPKSTTEEVDDGTRVDESCPWCGESLGGYPRVVPTQYEPSPEELERFRTDVGAET